VLLRQACVVYCKLSLCKTLMLLFLSEDEHGWLYAPHGTEPVCYSLTPCGLMLLRLAGWRPFEMPRVSRYLHESLLIDGMLELYAFKV
jgi:hypothetical protein